jgi:hypothetical protein
MSLNQLAITGDSITAGNVGGTNLTYGQGGTGSYAQLVRERLGNIKGLGPIASSGFYGIASSEGTWSISSGWSNTASTDAWDLGPYGTSGATSYQRYGNGSTKQVTFTYDANVTYPNHGFMLYCVDYTNGGNWSYSIDNGATWTASGITTTANKICKFYVTQAMGQGSTVIIRAANAAGTGVGCAPLGIEVFYQNPATASGLIVHNLALSGSNLHEWVATTSGDRLAWFKSSKITLGSGAISHLPNLGVLNEQINDVTGVQGDSVVWGTDLTTFYNAVSGLGPVGFISPYESYYLGAYPQATQTAFRSQTSTSATSLGAKYISWYTELANLGFTGYDQVKPAGYLVDGIHPSTKGNNHFSERIYWFIRNNFLSAYAATPSNYPHTAKQATVAYGSKTSSVAYSANTPIYTGR